MFSPKHRFFWPLAALVGFGLGLGILQRHAAALPQNRPEREVQVNPAGEIANSDNPGVVEIEKAELGRCKRVLAFSDGHGRYSEIVHLLLASGVIEMAAMPNVKDGKPTGTFRWGAAWQGSGTLLIVTGDSIDKGPQSLEILEMLFDLQRDQKNNNRIVVLLGNHEAEYLADPTAKKAVRVHEELIGQGYHSDDLARPDFVTRDGVPLGKFLRGLPAAARVGKWLFCHAGWIPAPSEIDPAQKTPAAKWRAFADLARTTLQKGHYAGLVTSAAEGEDKDSAGEILASLLEKKTDRNGKKWWKKGVPVLEARLTEYGLYGVVFGHQPKAFAVEDAIGHPAENDFHLIKIDTGLAVPGAPKENSSADPWPQPTLGHLLLFPDPVQLDSLTSAPTVKSLGFSKTLVTSPISAPEK